MTTRYGLFWARVALACACAEACVGTTEAAECLIDGGGAGTPTFPIRLFGGVISVPASYTLYGDSALARPPLPPALELHDLSQSALASILIGNVADAGESLKHQELLCTLGTLTVRQVANRAGFATVIYDDRHYVSLLSRDADAWKIFLRDFKRE